jgi:membrane-bound lytic murein transglycosylase B
MRLPQLKLKIPRLAVPRLRVPRVRAARLPVNRYKGGALWALAILAALAALPSLVPGEGSELFALGANGFTQQDEAAARYQAWLRGREAAKDAAGQQAAAQEAANGPGAAPPVQQVPLPAAVDAVIPALALRAYREAESWAAGFDPTCKLPWSLLAGIGRIESNHGRHLGGAARFSPAGDVTPTILGPVLNGAGTATIRDSDGGRWDGDFVWDRAVGPMQFIPSTWRSLGRDGNGDGVANPSNLFDAAVSAAGYLCLNSPGSMTDDTNLRNAIYAYNHSWEYVSAVITWANFYQQRAGLGSLATVPVAVGPASSGVVAGGAGGTGTGASSAGLPPVVAGVTGSFTAPPTASPAGPTTSRAGTTTTTRAGAPSTTAGPGTTTTTTQPPTTRSPTTTTTTTQPQTTTSTTTTTTTTTPPCPSTTTSSSTTSTTTTTTTSSTTTSTTLPCADQATAEPQP